MLNIYYGDMQESVYNTAAYFKYDYEDSWIIDPFVKEMIQDVDQSTVLDSGVIDSPVLGKIPPTGLSGGVKTLILVKFDKDKIFNASTCGDNCAKWLLKIAESEDRTINLRHLMNFGKDPFVIRILNTPYLESVWGDADPFDAVSCLMVKAADGSDIDALCQALVDAVPGSVAVRTADMVSGASSQLAVVEAIAVAFLIVLVILAALALAGRFSALAASRMRELGLLRTFGMSRGRVVGCFACEIGLVTLVAAVVAVVVACLVAGSVVGTFHSEFNMPGAAVPASAYGAAVAVGLLFAVALTAVALVQPVVQMLRRDPQETLTRGDM